MLPMLYLNIAGLIKENALDSFIVAHPLQLVTDRFKNSQIFEKTILK